MNCDICRKLVENKEELSYITINGVRVHGHETCLNNHLKNVSGSMLKESEKTQSVKKVEFLLG